MCIAIAEPPSSPACYKTEWFTYNSLFSTLLSSRNGCILCSSGNDLPRLLPVPCYSIGVALKASA